MNARQRTRTDAFRRVQKFGRDHAADFAAKAAPAGAKRRSAAKGKAKAAAGANGQTLGQRLPQAGAREAGGVRRANFLVPGS